VSEAITDCPMLHPLELFQSVSVTHVPLVPVTLVFHENHPAAIFQVALPVPVSFVNTYSLVAPETAVSAFIASCAVVCPVPPFAIATVPVTLDAVPVVF